MHLEFHVTTSVEDIKECVFLTYGKVKTSKKKDIILRIVFSIFFISAWLLLFFNPRSGMKLFMGYIGIIACTLGIMVTGIPLIGRYLRERRYVKNSTGLCQTAKIIINESGIRSISDDGSQDLFFSFDNITRLIISDNLYLFLSGIGVVIFFNRKYTGQQNELLNETIHQLLPQDKIIHRKS